MLGPRISPFTPSPCPTLALPVAAVKSLNPGHCLGGLVSMKVLEGLLAMCGVRWRRLLKQVRVLECPS